MSGERQKIIEAAQKLAERNQLDKAVVEYQRALREEPNDVRVLLKIGDLQVRMNARPAAVETYARVAATYDQQGFFLKAVAVYKQILQIDLARVDFYYKLADAYLKLGLVSDAMQNLEALAQRFAQSGQDIELLDVYRRMLAVDPTNIATHIRRAELLSKLGRNDEAAEGFAQGCALLEKVGRVDDWARVAERLFFHRPDDTGLALRLAGYYLERDDARRALPKLQVAYKADARDVNALEMLAAAFRGLGQLPKTVSVLKEVAKIHGEAGRAQKRADVYQRVLELAPTDAEAREALRAGSKASRRPASGAPSPVAPTTTGSVRRARPAPEVDEEDIDDEEIEELIVDDGDVVFDLKATVPPAEDEGALAEVPEIPPAPAMPAPARPQPQPRPFAPVSGQGLVIPPPVNIDRSPGAEAQRLVSEAEIFLKYGLRPKVSDHLAKAAQLDPLNAELRARMREIFEAMNDPEGVLRETLSLAELARGYDPQAALGEVLRALEIDPQNGAALRMHAELVGGQGETLPDDGVMVDDLDVPLVDEEFAVHGEVEVYAHASMSDPYGGGYAQPQPDEAYAADTYSEWSHGEAYAMPVASRPPQPVEDLGDVWGDAPAMESSRQIEEGLDEAEFFVTQGLYDDARDTLLGLLQIYPDHPLVLERWAEVDQLSRLQSGDEGAGSAYAIAAGLDEAVDDLGALSGPGVLDVHDELGSLHPVTEHALSAEDCDTHYDLGIAYKEMGLLDDAVAEFKIATMSPSRQCIGEMMIGMCYLEKAEVPLAIEHFRRGLQAPQRTEHEELGLYYEIGNAYELLGDLAEALYYFQKVEKRDPGFRDIPQKLMALQGYAPSAPRSTPAPNVEDFDRAFDDLVKD